MKAFAALYAELDETTTKLGTLLSAFAGRTVARP